MSFSAYSSLFSSSFLFSNEAKELSYVVFLPNVLYPSFFSEEEPVSLSGTPTSK